MKLIVQFLTTHFQFGTQGLLYLSSGLFNLSIGILVFLRNPKSRLNQSFFFLTINAFIWVIGYGLMSVVKSPSLIWFFLKFSCLGVSNVSLGTYFFSLAFSNQNENRVFKYIRIFSSVFISLFFFFYAEKVFEIKEYSWGRFNLFSKTELAQTSFWVLVAYFYVNLYGAIKNLFFHWRRCVEPSKRKKAKMIFFAFIFSYIGTLDFLITMGFDIYPTGFLALTYLIGMMAYTIARYKLFEINVVIKKLTLIFIVYSLLLVILIPTSFAFLNHVLGHVSQDQIILMILFGVVFGFILSLGPILYAMLLKKTYWLQGHSTTGLVHELKSPLGAIQGAIDIIRRDLKVDLPQVKRAADYVEMIDKNAQRLELYVQDLLSIAKIQEERIQLSQESFNFSAFVEEVIKEWSPQVKSKGLNFKINLEENIAVEADPKKMRQVLNNLISNCFKYSDKGVITLTLNRKNGHVLFSIQDEGIGLHPHLSGKIFDRFYQANKSYGGSGIGLSIAKAWVEAHQGDIWAESEGLGKGTTIRFTLPL